MTWGRENGDDANCPYVPWMCTYESMDDKINESYATMAENNAAELAGAGAVWRYLRSQHPEINLYVSDGSHPSVAGSYAAACALYTSIYKKNPEDISWNSSLSETVSQQIKTATRVVMYEDLTLWDFTLPLAAPNFTEIIEDYQVSFTNTSERYEHVSWDFGDGQESDANDPVHSYDQAGTYTVVLTLEYCGKSLSFSKILQIEDALGMADLRSHAFHFYPNPVHDVLNLDIKQPFETGQILIYTSSGGLVFQQDLKHLGKSSIDVSDWPTGFYLMLLRLDGQTWTHKLAKL